MQPAIAPLLASFVSLLGGAAVTAQGQVPPAVQRGLTVLPGLGAANTPGTNLQSISTIQLPSDPIGTYYVSATAANVPASAGGMGGSDVWTGRYDAVTDTLTANLDAAALNTAGTEFGLSLHHSGLLAVVDRLPGAPVLAQRASSTQPFAVLGRVTGLPTQPYYDPSLATVDGVLHLICTVGNNLAMGPLNLTTRAVGTMKVIARPIQASWTLNSSCPITDSSGELIGVSYHEINPAFTDNDHYLGLDLDPATPGLLVVDTANFTSNSDFVGGRFIEADNVGGAYTTKSVDAYWCTGGLGSVGGSMEVRAYVPPTASTTPWVSTLLLSSGFSAPTTVPGVGGQLGLNPALLLSFTIGLHDRRTGQATLTIPVPNDPSLSGQFVPAQAVTFDAANSSLTLGNTCALRVR